MTIWWQVFYILYFLTSIRFFLHNGMLAFPLPKKKKETLPELDASDCILIQYPVRNEPKHILERFFNSLSTIPEEHRHRFQVQLLNDYDKDKDLGWRFKAVISVLHMKRHNKKGGKAGNLNFGLKLANPKFKWVMIYDSDHVVDGTKIVDAVRRLKANPKLMCVQSRWVIQNKFNTPLSWLQDQFTHLHIDREQVFKSMYNLWPIFNGAGAVFNREILERECGGWMERTISEDIDLSGHLQFRGYKIEVMPEWKTGIDCVTEWEPYIKQQKRWAKGNGQRLRYHLNDNAGWGFKKLYWISWNSGLFIAPTKYVIPIVMILKLLGILRWYWFDWFGLIPHAFVLIASMQDWDNKIMLKYLFLYPVHYILELRMLHIQIKAFLDGFINYKSEFEFEVTEKK